MAVTRTKDGWKAAYKLSERLACLGWSTEVPFVDGADGLLDLLVAISDGQGRYYADVPLLIPRIRCGGNENVTRLDVYEWRDELLRRGDIKVSPDAENCYGGTHLVLTIQGKNRFQRWANRAHIPVAIRKAVYLRDGNRCRFCGSEEDLSLDHIIPWSRGGPDMVENLRVLCRSCNSSRGNREDD